MQTVTILTSTYDRPEFLKKLADTIIPVLLANKKNLTWKVVVDQINNSYDKILIQIKEKSINDNFNFEYIEQKNIGKFKTMVREFSKVKTDWMTVIDDDDQVIGFKLENFIKKIHLISNNVPVILVPRLTINKNFFFHIFKNKKKLFKQYNNKILNFYKFKKIFRDTDTTIFIRSNSYSYVIPEEIKHESFTAESLFYMTALKNHEVMIINDNLVYSQYLPSGLTGRSYLNRISNPFSAHLVAKTYLEASDDLKISYLFFKSLSNYYRFFFHSKQKKKIIIESNINIFFIYFCFLIGFLSYVVDYLIIKKKK